MLASRKRTQGGASLCPGLSHFAPLGRTDQEQARGKRSEAGGERREAGGERREARGERREARGERDQPNSRAIEDNRPTGKTDGEELKRGYLNILLVQMFKCPANDISGFTIAKHYRNLNLAVPDTRNSDLLHRKPAIEVRFRNRDRKHSTWGTRQ
jgi:hypothetical protein